MVRAVIPELKLTGNLEVAMDGKLVPIKLFIQALKTLLKMHLKAVSMMDNMLLMFQLQKKFIR